MDSAALSVRGLGKRFRLGGWHGVDYRGMHGLLEELARAPFRRGAAPSGAELWALRDVSFDVRPGEVVGLIGRNGAGKSVLLKLLARITPPTEGEARVFGRVGALLEAGAGLDPELTGRENIYFSGAVLGMGRVEIDRRFDAIVAFSGVEKHLDMPIKRFSSGMNVRLAVSVAVHLDAEILLLDEVLAVGDETFLAACIARLRALTAEGRTILFVSHDMSLLERLCGRALLLGAGRLEADGPAQSVVRRYLAESPG